MHWLLYFIWNNPASSNCWCYSSYAHRWTNCLPPHKEIFDQKLTQKHRNRTKIWTLFVCIRHTLALILYSEVNKNVVNLLVRRRLLSEILYISFYFAIFLPKSLCCENYICTKRINSIQNNLLLESRCGVRVYQRGAVLMLHLKLLRPIYNLHRLQLLLNIMLLLLPCSQNSRWIKVLFCNSLVNFQLLLLHSIVA